MATIQDRVETVENAVIRLSDEMRAFKDEMLADRRDMNKQWGNLANKMGTIVEDLIVPAVRPVVRKYFSVEPFFFGHTLRKRQDGGEYELDVLTISDQLAFLVEAKPSPKPEHVDATLDKASYFTSFLPRICG